MKQALRAAWLLLAVGCGRPVADPAPPSASPDGAFPVTIRDGLGRSVTIAKRPVRIVSLSPAITETLFAIGAGPRVVAVTTTDTFPAEVKRLPTVGGFAPQTISTESILAFRPDLVVAAGRFHQPVVETLGKLGLTVVAVETNTIEEVENVIALIGQATGQDAEAAAVVADFRRRREAVRQRTANAKAPVRPKVLYVLGDNPLMIAGPKTFIGQMIVDAGGSNVFADTSAQYPHVSDEAVLERDPDLILVPDHGNTGLPERIRKRVGWDKLTAVRNGRIGVLNEDLSSRPGPRLIEGLEAIEALLRNSK